ncbi:hypothetical protein BCR44DRAFT_1425332, partial [Catenaria anguillulae PL171]
MMRLSAVAAFMARIAKSYPHSRMMIFGPRAQELESQVRVQVTNGIDQRLKQDSSMRLSVGRSAQLVQTTQSVLDTEMVQLVYRDLAERTA